MKPIKITDSVTMIRAYLNDTLAARDFQKRLPFCCCGYDSGMDYCCTVASGLYDPGETKVGWKNGDISLGGGWFTLIYGGEEESNCYRNMMIIGHILEEDIHLIKKFPGKVCLQISIAD